MKCTAYKNYSEFKMKINESRPYLQPVIMFFKSRYRKTLAGNHYCNNEITITLH